MNTYTLEYHTHYIAQAQDKFTAEDIKEAFVKAQVLWEAAYYMHDYDHGYLYYVSEDDEILLGIYTESDIEGI